MSFLWNSTAKSTNKTTPLSTKQKLESLSNDHELLKSEKETLENLFVQNVENLDSLTKDHELLKLEKEKLVENLISFNLEHESEIQKHLDNVQSLEETCMKYETEKEGYEDDIHNYIIELTNLKNDLALAQEKDSKINDQAKASSNKLNEIQKSLDNSTKKIEIQLEKNFESKIRPNFKETQESIQNFVSKSISKLVFEQQQQKDQLLTLFKNLNETEIPKFVINVAKETDVLITNNTNSLLIPIESLNKKINETKVLLDQMISKKIPEILEDATKRQEILITKSIEKIIENQNKIMYNSIAELIIQSNKNLESKDKHSNDALEEIMVVLKEIKESEELKSIEMIHTTAMDNLKSLVLACETTNQSQNDDILTQIKNLKEELINTREIISADSQKKVNEHAENEQRELKNLYSAFSKNSVNVMESNEKLGEKFMIFGDGMKEERESVLNLIETKIQDSSLAQANAISQFENQASKFSAEVVELLINNDKFMGFFKEMIGDKSIASMATLSQEVVTSLGTPQSKILRPTTPGATVADLPLTSDYKRKSTVQDQDIDINSHQKKAKVSKMNKFHKETEDTATPATENKSKIIRKSFGGQGELVNEENDENSFWNSKGLYVRPESLKKSVTEHVVLSSMKKISPDQTKKISPDQIKKFSPDQIKKTSPDQKMKRKQGNKKITSKKGLRGNQE